MSKLVELPPHERMTSEQALSVAGRTNWEGVIVVGFSKDHNDLVFISSHMTCEQALWIVEHAKRHVLKAE